MRWFLLALVVVIGFVVAALNPGVGSKTRMTLDGGTITDNDDGGFTYEPSLENRKPHLNEDGDTVIEIGWTLEPYTRQGR